MIGTDVLETLCRTNSKFTLNSLYSYVLPLVLEAPLRLIGGTTNFNLYYSLYVNNVNIYLYYYCIVT